MLGALVHSEKEAEWGEAAPPIETLASRAVSDDKAVSVLEEGPPGQEAGSEGTQVSFVGTYRSELDADSF